MYIDCKWRLQNAVVAHNLKETIIITILVVEWNVRRYDQTMQELSSVHLTQELDKWKYSLYNQYLSRDHFRLLNNPIPQLTVLSAME